MITSTIEAFVLKLLSEIDVRPSAIENRYNDIYNRFLFIFSF